MQRIKSLDLARGFTVMFIAPIHTVMLYSNSEVYTTWSAYFLKFIAEGPGAQLFMLLMGMYIAFQPEQNMQTVAKRAGILLLSGYGLNIVKFVLPMYSGIIPVEMQQDLMVENNYHGLLQLLGLGDILHFAAIALLITHAVRRQKNYPHTALVLAVVALLVSPLLWDATSNNKFINYGLALLAGQPLKVFFPLLPWLFYPLLGLVIGSAIKQNTETTYPQLLKWGMGWVLFAFIAHTIAGNHYNTSFYRTYPWDTLGHAGIVLIILWLWEWLHQYIKPNRFFDCLVFYSKHITLVYIIQWILIIWLLPFFGYHKLDYWHSIIAITITSTLTFLLTMAFNRIKKLS